MILYPEEPSLMQTDNLNENSIAYAIGEDAIICPHYDEQIQMFHQRKKSSKKSGDLRGNMSNPRL